MTILTVLIVDDSQSIRKMLYQGVRDIIPDSMVFEADGAVEAGRFLSRSIPDIIFLDLNMPVVSGIEFLDGLEGILNGRKAPIIVSISADVSDATLEALRQRGVYDLLPKPFVPVGLGRVLIRVLQMIRPREALIVDDSATVRHVVRRVMAKSRFNLEIHEARDGEQALKLIKSKKFDIVFIDFNMPGMDGLETAGEILDSAPETNIVMMSGEDDEATRRAAAHIGVKHFLKKPFYADSVDATLHMLFELPSAQFVEAAEAEEFLQIDLAET
jgi:CheY-like chemotaxis protein